MKEAADPFTVASAVMTAGFSQKGDQTPGYGEGAAAYGKRFGAALADFSSQSFFSAGVMASLLHQDPRYYRRGPGHPVASRVLYSVQPAGDRAHGFRQAVLQRLEYSWNGHGHRGF